MKGKGVRRRERNQQIEGMHEGEGREWLGGQVVLSLAPD